MEHATNDQQPVARRRRGGWSEQAFEEIVQQFISHAEPGKFYIYDISSPPGSGKTFTVLKFIVTRRIPAVCSFPTHQNQATALTYIVSLMSSEDKPRLFVVDYAGLENYCIFYRPALLRKLLSQFKPEGGSYVDAAQRLLGEDVLFKALLLQDTFTASEKIYTKIAELFDAGKHDHEVLELTKSFVERRGQYEVCFGVCPIGLLFSFYSQHVYELLSKPKIITWRYTLAEKLSKKYNFRHIVVASPARFVSNVKTVLEGNLNPEWLLCPRLLLMRKCTTVKTRDNRRVPTYLSLRRTVILTPHAGLQFILNLVTRQKEVTGTTRRHLLYIDEYDALMKPRKWKVFSLGEAKAVKALADMVASKEEGEEFRNVVIDEYLKRYAQYVSYVLGKVVDIVEHSIKSGEYSPYTVLFIEGAFSKFREAVLETRIPIEYLPLGARVVHIKHLLQDEELFKLLVNPKLFFIDLAEKDPDWAVRFREASATFKQLIRTARCTAMRPGKSKNKLTSQTYLQLVPREKRAEDIVSELSDLVKHVLYIPRMALYYAVDERNIVVESIDAQISQFLTWGRHAILTSATPISHDLYVLGTHSAVPSSDYEAVTKNISFSFAKFSPPAIEEYDHYTVRKYVGKVLVYTDEFSRALRDSVTSDTAIHFDASSVIPSVLEISQISPITTIVKEYSRLVKILPQPSLRPLTYRMLLSASSSKNEPIIQSVRSYAMLVDVLVRAGFRVLVLTQNKEVALFLARLMKMEKCLGDVCREGVEKISHFKSRNGKVVLTWFRSRIGRGVDLDVRTDAVVVVGSPYPHLRVFVNYKSYERVFDSKHSLMYIVKPLNTTGNTFVYKCLVPRDFVSGLNELAQALGRAIRSILNLEHSEVRVYLPSYVFAKFTVVAPLWLKSSLRGLA